MKISLKTLALTLGVGGCALLASGAMAFDVVSDTNNAFSLTGPLETFTSWAVGGGATSNGFDTISATNTTWNFTNYFSGSPLGSTWTSIIIPFNFAVPIGTAQVNFSSICNAYGNNWGAAKILLTDGNGVSTQLYCQKANSTDPSLDNYNYTFSQTPTAGFYKGYTDFSTLVAGQTSFTLTLTSGTGWDSPMDNGGGFFAFDTRTPGNRQDFVLSGTTAAVPEPSALLAMASGLIGMLGFAGRRRK